MPQITEQELKQQMTSGHLASLYVLTGEEKYLVKRGAKRLINISAGESFPEFNKNEFGSTAAVDEISDAAEALPFMAEHKCVCVSDFNVEEQNATELDKLYQLLDNLPETTTLVFWYPTLVWDGKKSAKWRKFLKTAGEKGNTLIYNRRDAGDLRRMLLREAEKAGCVLSRENANKILEYAGADVTLLLHEMEKLCAFALGAKAKAEGNSPAEITGRMIEDLVSKSTETTVFLMANALVAGNYEKAYALMDTLFYQNEEPIAIVGALAASYVDMYRVKAALESGLPANAPAEYGDYKGKEFRLRNAQRNVRGATTPMLRRSIDLLLDADLSLKSSSVNKRMIMDRLIARLLLESQLEKERDYA